MDVTDWAAAKAIWAAIKESGHDIHDDLVVLKNNFKLLHPNPEDFKGLVIVQADKMVDFKIIKKVMYTCSVAGYANVNFAVQSGKKGGG